MATDNAAIKATIAAKATTTAVATTAIAKATETTRTTRTTHFSIITLAKRSPGEGKQARLFKRN